MLPSAGGYVEVMVSPYLVGGIICERCDTVQRRGSYEAEMQIDDEFGHDGCIWDVVVVSRYLDKNRIKKMTIFNTANRSCLLSTLVSALYNANLYTLLHSHWSTHDRRQRRL